MTGVLPPGQIPSGITFGRRVLLVASVSDVFSHSGRIRSTLDSAYCSWIQRGATIGKYQLDREAPKKGFFGKAETVTAEVDIGSPVSGLVLHNDYRFQFDKRDFARKPESEYKALARLAILLPDDEPPPMPSSTIFRSMTDICWQGRETFLAPSRYWSLPAMTESDLRDHLDDQLALPHHFVDAMPQYEEYLQDARTRYSELRPHLKHLL
jgi:hypothetical protein